MAKKQKKRNKKYTGIDAKTDDNMVTVRKVTAINRGPLRQWIFEHKKVIRIIAIVILVIAVIVAMLVIAI